MTRLPSLYKARGVPVKMPVCAICLDRTRGKTLERQLTHGVRIWLCEGHHSIAIPARQCRAGLRGHPGADLACAGVPDAFPVACAGRAPPDRPGAREALGATPARVVLVAATPPRSRAGVRARCTRAEHDLAFPRKALAWQRQGSERAHECGGGSPTGAGSGGRSRLLAPEAVRDRHPPVAAERLVVQLDARAAPAGACTRPGRRGARRAGRARASRGRAAAISSGERSCST